MWLESPKWLCSGWWLVSLSYRLVDLSQNGPKLTFYLPSNHSRLAFEAPL